jgi:transglutaminase-like putative cysteine protease
MEMKNITFRLIYSLVLSLLLISSFACITLHLPGEPSTSPETPPFSPQTNTGDILTGSSQIITKLGETEYDVQYQVLFKNSGPGVITRLLLRLALPANRDPSQQVQMSKSEYGTGKKYEDENNNVFTEIELFNIKAMDEVPVTITHKVAVSQLQFNLDNCNGKTITKFLQPEQWTESDSSEIVALTKQITLDKQTPCAKARAIYDWIGINIKYGGYTGEDRGALFCLTTKSGDCSEFSYLMIAMCRAVGIPARFIEGFAYEASKTQISDLKHDWVEIYLSGIGWVPADPTWGRSKINRDAYFARMPSDHIIITIGNPQALAKWAPPFHYVEYQYWWNFQKPVLTFTEKLNLSVTK